MLTGLHTNQLQGVYITLQKLTCWAVDHLMLDPSIMSTLALVLFLLLPLTDAETPWQLCGNGGNYTANSSYQSNLNQLSAALPKKTSSNTNLFATGTAGTAPDKVYALALCRGDINASACNDCVATGFQDAQHLCASSKDATVYYGSCLLHFSNANFLATTHNIDLMILMNSQNFTENPDSMRLMLFTLLNNTAQYAASSSRRFTTASLDQGFQFRI